MKGVYLLFLKNWEEKCIDVGSLGSIKFEKGVYIYCGSGMKNVLKRVERHFSTGKEIHWHIDYVLEKMDLEDYLVIPENSEYECFMAGILEEEFDGVPGFGCSDCKCDSHFFHVPESKG